MWYGMNGTYSFYAWGMMIILFSLVGFLVENIWISFRFGYMDNRNMNLPFLLGYGVAVEVAYLLFGLPAESFDWGYYLKLFFIISIGEILLGMAVEELCGIHYWDYTSLPCHVTRYTSLFTSLGLALIGYSFMGHFFVPVMEIFQAHVSVMNNVLCAVMLFLLVLDFAVSFYEMYRRRDFNRRWKYEYRWKLFRGARKEA